MQPLIKWPGGKSSEIEYIKDLIPEQYGRYIEPFCGGAAVYFYLQPKKAIINDISSNLTDFYKLIKEENQIFKKSMYDLNLLWEDIKIKSKKSIIEIEDLFKDYKNSKIAKEEAKKHLQN